MGTGYSHRTSGKAWDEIQPHLGGMQVRVLKYMDQTDRPVCNYEIAEGMRKPVNTITPRVNELVKKGFVRPYKIQQSPTGKSAQYWDLEPEFPSPISLFMGRTR